ncbi:glycosyltransferase family 2 protein [Streptomyces sp. NPDC056773]|uniref:glycosyltransferase family 2 protein n=1 Tax=unclassified Streptomyces TaxID=2593676 RepID=UPI00369E0736
MAVPSSLPSPVHLPDERPAHGAPSGPPSTSSAANSTSTSAGKTGSVTVIIPSFNEAGNVEELLGRLGPALDGLLAEVLFVDDSTDDTPAVIEKAAETCPVPVAVLHREAAEGGLGGAVLEGIRRASCEWIVVMDADLQHPPHLVPELVAAGERTGADLVVASRYTSGGSRAGLAGGYRIAISRGATWLAKGLFPRALRGISDPMSGFFAIRRAALATTPQGEGLRPLGYKILLELLVRLRPRQVAEVPFAFQERYAGESKSTAREGLRFLAHVSALRTATQLPRVIGFGLIGLSGFVPNLAALWLLTGAGVHYLPAEVLANQAGVLWNFLLVEALLFRDRRWHRPWAVRLGRFALLANADLLLRIPLIALLVGSCGLAVLPATALALAATFIARFATTQTMVYLPRGHRATTPRRTIPGRAPTSEEA